MGKNFSTWELNKIYNRGVSGFVDGSVRLTYDKIYSKKESRN